MRIITISREFGSGGREIGKRLADALDIAYYDREIIAEIAKKSALDPSYVEKTLERGIIQYPITFAHTLIYMSSIVGTAPDLLVKQHQVVREIAEKGEDCVIVGRGADAILEEYAPLNFFVHAQMHAKMERCRKRAAEQENMTDRELERKIKQLDKARASNHDMVSTYPWGDRRGYQLCINTTGLEIKAIIPALVSYAEAWFTKRDPSGRIS